MVVSIRDVADRAGVSVGTVSNVLNRPSAVADETVRRVRRAIDELGYVRNDAARQLRAGRSTTVGLIVLDARNPFFMDVARGAEDEAGTRGLSVLVGNSGEQLDREAAYLALFQEQRVRGVLVSPIGDDLDRFVRLRESGIPVVLVDRGAPGSGFSYVSVDDERGGYLAVRHLLDQGRRRIAFVGGPPELRQVADRLAGARRAVAEVADATLEVLSRPALTVLEGRAAGEDLAARRSGGPDAVFAANDLLAIGVMQAFIMTRDIRVPGDIALIGFDDIDFAQSAVVPLTSVRQPSEAIGATALGLLADEADGAAPREIQFEPELVIRESTAG